MEWRLLCLLKYCYHCNRSIVDSYSLLFHPRKKNSEVDGDLGSGTDHKPYCFQILTNQSQCWSLSFFFLLEFCVKGKAEEASEVSININIVWSPSVVTCTPSSSMRPLKIKSQMAGFPPSEMKVTKKNTVESAVSGICARWVWWLPRPFRRLTKSRTKYTPFSLKFVL